MFGIYKTMQGEHRRYPEISVGDLVCMNITPKPGITKGHGARWSSEKYKVLRIDGNNDLLNHLTKTSVPPP